MKKTCHASCSAYERASHRSHCGIVGTPRRRRRQHARAESLHRLSFTYQANGFGVRGTVGALVPHADDWLFEQTSDHRPRAVPRLAHSAGTETPHIPARTHHTPRHGPSARMRRRHVDRYRARCVSTRIRTSCAGGGRSPLVPGQRRAQSTASSPSGWSSAIPLWTSGGGSAETK